LRYWLEENFKLKGYTPYENDDFEYM